MKEFRKKIYSLISNGRKRSVANRIYNALVIIITVISLSSLMFKEDREVFYNIDIVAGIIFLIDYILRWMTADYKYKYKNISDTRAFLIYPFRLHAVLDLIAIISTLPAFFGGMRMIEIFDTMSLFRVIKCVRIFKLLKYSTSFNIIYIILQKQKKVLLTVLLIAASYIFVSAVIVFQIEPKTFPTFFDAIYWAVISLTTVGYGDIYPTSTYGRFFSMISAFFGIAFVALPAGIISGGYLEVIMEQKTKEQEKEKEREKEKEKEQEKEKRSK